MTDEKMLGSFDFLIIVVFSSLAVAVEPWSGLQPAARREGVCLESLAYVWIVRPFVTRYK